MTEPTHVDWIRAARASHERLSGIAAGLTEDQLVAQSYDTEWTVAQVLSHIGSGAEIFGLMAQASLAGADSPGSEQFQAVWAVWNAKSPVAMRDDALASNTALVELFEAITPEQAASVQISFGPFSVDIAGLVRMRLSEHALHTWDVAVFLDPAAAVAQDAAALLLPGLGQMAERAGKPADPAFSVRLVTTDGLGAWAVRAGATAEFGAADETASYDGEVSLPGEALLRLIAGRLDVDHTPAGITESGVRGLADLRRVFQGL
ncbi:maleylpyruvate isomerase N-terminal domain-containing protein [Longivirga aurantiaca]|uniref:Maleylpyruvate isomerase N-terminal domain-containing protein n=1 Tax=Longivirga aurantiaca TaxID=1837743 RepID=A0ABW1SY23_9ACTN